MKLRVKTGIHILIPASSVSPFSVCVFRANGSIVTTLSLSSHTGPLTDRPVDSFVKVEIRIKLEKNNSLVKKIVLCIYLFFDN